MFKAKLLTEDRAKNVKVYVAGRKSSPIRLKRLQVQKIKKVYTLGWYFTGDADVLNQLLML